MWYVCIDSKIKKKKKLKIFWLVPPTQSLPTSHTKNLHTYLDNKAEPAALFRTQMALRLITSCPCEDARAAGGPHCGTPTKRLLPHAKPAIATKTLQQNLAANLVQIDSELHKKHIGMVHTYEESPHF